VVDFLDWSVFFNTLSHKFFLVMVQFETFKLFLNES